MAVVDVRLCHSFQGHLRLRIPSRDRGTAPSGRAAIIVQPLPEHPPDTQAQAVPPPRQAVAVATSPAAYAHSAAARLFPTARRGSLLRRLRWARDAASAGHPARGFILSPRWVNLDLGESESDSLM